MNENLRITLTIVTYRDIFNWLVKQKSGFDDEYLRRSAIVHLSDNDMKALGIREGSAVKLYNHFGAIIARAWLDTSCLQGFGYMPTSSYVNTLTSYDPAKRKLPNSKGILVTVEVIPEEDCPFPLLTPWWRVPLKTERPQPLQIYSLLPKTNCKLCGCPTCTAFAFSLITREKGLQDCPELLSDSFREPLQILRHWFSENESIADTGLLIRKERCNGCGDCVLLCHKAIGTTLDHVLRIHIRRAEKDESPVLKVVNGVIEVVNWTVCRRPDGHACRLCEEKCRFGALELVR